MKNLEAPAPADSRPRALLFLAIAVTLVTWASAYAAIRHAVRAFPPGALALMRFAVASLVLAAIVLPSRRVGRRGLPARDLWGFARIGLLGVALYHVALNAGERTVAAGAASLLINTAPIWTALIATAFLGDRLGVRGWLGLALAFSGAAVVSIGSAGGIRFEGDVALVLLASLFTAIYFVLQKPYLARYGALEAACYTIWLGTLFLLPFAPQCMRALKGASAAEIRSAIYLGIAPGAIGYVTWTFVLSRLTAPRAASLLYMIPPLAFLIGWITLGEKPGLHALLGGVPILVGVALVNTGRASTGRPLVRTAEIRPEASSDR